MPGDFHFHLPQLPSVEKLLGDLLPETAAERDRRLQLTQGKTIGIRLPRVLGKTLQGFYWGPPKPVVGKWVTVAPDDAWRWHRVPGSEAE